MRRVAALVLVAGCNSVFGLEPTAVIPDVDTDGDGIIDLVDNCPDQPNAAQHDEDADGVGDACDSCPLIANADDEDIGDHDGIGDLCDPHPLDAGDCLVVLDSFADAAGFAAHWQVVSQEPSPRVVAEDESVVLMPADPLKGGIAIVEPSLTGGDYDVSVAGRATLTQGRFAVTTGKTTVDDGYGCILDRSTTSEAFDAGVCVFTPTTLCATSISYFTRPPVRDDVLLSLAVDPGTPTPRVRCRGRHGIAVGENNLAFPASFPNGHPGAIAVIDPARVEAIAIYHLQPGTPCAPPIVR